MRQIKFRGLSINGEWHHGLLSHSTGERGHTLPEGYYISNKAGMPWAYQIRPETIGQLTGLTDKNGKEIYEGDIIRVPELYETPEMTGTQYVNWQIEFIHGSWHMSVPGKRPDLDEADLFQEYRSYDENFEIIGNIYSNPELLTP